MQKLLSAWRSRQLWSILMPERHVSFQREEQDNGVPISPLRHSKGIPLHSMCPPSCSASPASSDELRDTALLPHSGNARFESRAGTFLRGVSMFSPRLCGVSMFPSCLCGVSMFSLCLCGVSMFSLCLCGFPPGFPVSSHSPKTRR